MIKTASAKGQTTQVTMPDSNFGILGYAPGEDDWKGAVVTSVAQPFYQGDPEGRARKAGVQPGMVVKSINGKDVTSADFDDIMLAVGHYTWDGKSRVLTPGFDKVDRSMHQRPKVYPVKLEFQSVS
ncbi:unnamed protein product [Prorocentrum cordatum]|uniref:PDZ domain-containing protein n=1 Tax=Prorocentrum cordatum TaxID=2364126 RepID=A0ABN9RWZ1_9DINO|nr:unnamed protein product [Polarella glacialis]